MQTRDYPGIKADMNQLINEIRNFFDNNDYDVQDIREYSAVVIQARKSSTIRDWTGTSYALTIKISLDDAGTHVAIGRQKWLDKAVIGGVALATPFGLIVGPVVAFGAYKQYKITEDAWNTIDKHMARRSGGSFSSLPTTCKQCGTLSSGGRFCSNCGNELS